MSNSKPVKISVGDRIENFEHSGAVVLEVDAAGVLLDNGKGKPYRASWADVWNTLGLRVIHGYRAKPTDKNPRRRSCKACAPRHRRRNGSCSGAGGEVGECSCHGAYHGYRAKPTGFFGTAPAKRKRVKVNPPRGKRPIVVRSLGGGWEIHSWDGERDVWLVSERGFATKREADAFIRQRRADEADAAAYDAAHAAAVGRAREN
jgi:hypothetical protein